MTDTAIAKKLIDQTASLDPSMDTGQLFRVCHLLCNSTEVIEGHDLDNPEVLGDLWSEISLRLQAASDQHAAVTEELSSLATSDPSKFSPDQIWTLVKTIKVLNQILSLYTKEQPN